MPCAGHILGLAAAKSFARALLPLMPHAAVFVFDRDLRLQYADGGPLRQAGYDPRAMHGQSVPDALPGEAWPCLADAYHRALAGEEFAVDYQALSGRRYRIHGSPVLDDDGAVQGGMLVAVDAVTPAEERLTMRLRQQSAVAQLGKLAVTEGAELDVLIGQAAQLVSETLTVAGVSLAEIDVDRHELLVRFDSSAQFTGRRSPLAGSLCEKVLSAQAPVVIDDAALAADQLPAPLEAAGIRSVAYVPIGPATDPFGMLGAFRREPDAFTSDDVHFLEAIAFVLNEAATREKTDAELRRQALHDPVTGLPNRTLLHDRLKQTLAVSARAGLRTGVLFIDLDHFKDVNDSLGHQAGDEVLCAVATRLRSAVRGSDTVARFGGDEFVIAAAALEDESDAIRIANAVVTLLEAPILVGDEQVYVRASIGIRLAQSQGAQDPRTLITEADAAMYRAKARGRNRYEFVDPAEAAQPTNRVIVARDLRQALADGDLRLAFQPFVRLRDGAPTGAEVLLRWQHPTEGYIKPGDFLDVAEHSGLIVPIGEWMLERACHQAARWNEGGEFLLSINVSASQLADPGIVDAVGAALASSGLPPDRLGLELTEQVLVGDERDALRTLTDLKRLGVTLLLDDFGTGFSSLSHLKRFPIDIVKIDRSFIEGLDLPDSRGDDAAIVSAIVGMSRATGKRVIPEGIETEAQVQALLDLGCDSGQGYFFARPLQVSHFDEWLAERAAAR